MQIRSLVLMSIAVVTSAQSRVVLDSGTVAGTVLDSATDNPVPGATVQLWQGDVREPRIEHADGAGRFRFAAVPFGPCTLQASAPGFFQHGKHAHSYVFTFRRSTFPPNVIPIETTVTEILKLDRCGAIFGRVAASDAQPPVNGSIPDATRVRVELLQRRPRRPSTSAESDFSVRRGIIGEDELDVVAGSLVSDKGEYRFDELEPGTYYLAAVPLSPYVSASSGRIDPATEDAVARTTYHQGSLRAAGATPVTIAAGEDPKNIDLEIIRRRGMHVRGRLVLPTGFQGWPYISASVSLWPERTPGEMWPIPDVSMRSDDGRLAERFELANVLPGRYVLHAEVNAAAVPDNSNMLPTIYQALGGEREVEVGDTPLDGVELLLRPPVNLSGELQFAANCQVAPIVLRLGGIVPFSGGGGAAISDLKGTVQLRRLFPGRYSIRTMERDRYFVESLHIDGSDLPTDELQIGERAPERIRIAVGCK